MVHKCMYIKYGIIYENFNILYVYINITLNIKRERCLGIKFALITFCFIYLINIY